jgi:hypothetical protein
MKKHLFSREKMSESCDRPPSAAEIFLKTKDLLTLFVDKYVDDTGTLLSMARLTRRTMELFYDHPDLVLARNAYRQFEPEEHIDPTPQVSREEAASSEWKSLDPSSNCCRKARLRDMATVTCHCICHSPCAFCIGKVPLAEHREKIDPKMVNGRDCEMYQRHLNALYVHGNIRLAVYYRGLAGRILSPTFDVVTEKLLKRGHHALVNWVFDRAVAEGRSFTYSTQLFCPDIDKEFDIQGVQAFQSTILAQSLGEIAFYKEYPKKEFLPTLDAALRYLQLLNIPATIQIAKDVMNLFISGRSAMCLKALQAFFTRFPDLKTVRSRKNSDDDKESIPARYLCVYLTNLFLEYTSNQDWDEDAKCVLLLLDLFPDKESVLAERLHSAMLPQVDGDEFNDRREDGVFDRFHGKCAAKTLTRLFKLLDEHVFGGDEDRYRRFYWPSFFGTAEFHQWNGCVIEPAESKHHDPRWRFAKLMTMTKEIGQRGTVDDAHRARFEGQRVLALLRAENAFTEYMGFIAPRISHNSAKPENILKGDDDDDQEGGEPVQKRSRQ